MKYFFAIIPLFFACNKLLELPPNNSFIAKGAIESNDHLLQSLIGSLYNDLHLILNGGTSTNPSANLGMILGASADEFMEAQAIGNLPVRHAFYNTYHNSQFETTSIPDFFTPMYQLVIRCNIVLNDFLLKDSGRYQQEISETRAIRSILYYYLIQLYGSIPLMTNADIDSNFKQPRVITEVISSFCIQELEDVYPKLLAVKAKVNDEPTRLAFTERINKHVVAYYLSAFYLLTNDYANSIKYSLELKNAYAFNEFSTKFLISSTENIWILNPSVTSSSSTTIKNNINANFLHYKLFGSSTFFTSSRPFSLSERLVSKFTSFDRRRSVFLDSVRHTNTIRYLPYKYRFVSSFGQGGFDINSPERFVLIRLPAVYFNLMEAYFQNNQKDNALAVFNEIGRINYTDYVDVTDITLEDIVQERFKELFAENGDRWFTLKRTGLADKVMTEYLPLKNNNAEPWNREKMLYLPIPFNATNLNPNL